MSRLTLVEIALMNEESKMKKISETNLKVIIALFFVTTGATGLIYQITWFKYISLFLGNTTYAQMIVLSTFLGGLALGNYFFGKRAEKIHNHIFLYGVLELLVGIYCFVYPTLSLFLGDIFLSTATNLSINSQNTFFVFFRYIFTSSLLLLPTFAMGGTLPIISKFFIKNVQNTRRELAILYFLNSFGAVWGIILSGFFMIKLIGLNNSMYLTAFINTIIGILAILLSKLKEETKESEELSPGIESKNYQLSKRTLSIIVLTAGTSGMAALLYEIVWVRLLVNFLGSSTYAFSIMLLAFISGITLGSFLVSQDFLKKYNKIKLVIFFQSSIGITTMISLMFYERLPYYLWNIAGIFNKNEASFGVFLTIEFLISFSLLLLPTIFMGMTLPVIVDIITNINKKIGFSVGKIFSVNTVGTVVGVLLTSLVFIPLFGIKGSFEIGIIINLLSAIILLLSYEAMSRSSKIKTAGILAGSFILFSLLLPQWNVNTLVSGVFRKFKHNPPESYSQYNEHIRSDSILYYKEGISANVAVLETKKNIIQRKLVINGKADASTSGDMPTQVLLGQIPSMLHKNPKDVFVVGFGSGTTMASVLTHDVKRIVCTEMNKEVIEAAEYFNEVNNNCLSDPRLEIEIEDALTYLKMTDENFDIIISEPSNPWIAGIGNLFSKEYFELCRKKLNKDGIMVQWFHLYELNDEILQLVLSTFKYVFPNVQVWGSLSSDIILVGTEKEIELDGKLLESKINNKKINDDFKRIGIDNLFTFLSLQQLSNKGVFKLTDFYKLNSELHPTLEFMAPKSFYIGRTSNLIMANDEKVDLINNKNLLIKKYFENYLPKPEHFTNAAKYHIEKIANFRFAYSLTNYFLEQGVNDYELVKLNYMAQKKLNVKYLSQKLDNLFENFSDSIYVKKEYLNWLISKNIISSSFLKTYSIEPFVQEFIQTINKEDTLAKARIFADLAKLLYDNGELKLADSCRGVVKKIFENDPSISAKIDLRKFLNISCRLNLYWKRDTEFLMDYKTLSDFFPTDKNITVIEKMFILRSQEIENRNKDL